MNCYTLVFALIYLAQTMVMAMHPMFDFRSFESGKEAFDVERLEEIYYGRLPQATEADIAIFDQMVADIGDEVNCDLTFVGEKDNAVVLRDLMKKGCFESYRCLLSILSDPEAGEYYFDSYFMMECAEYERLEYVGAMMDQGVDTMKVVTEIIETMAEYTMPEHGIDVLLFLMERDPDTAALRPTILHDALANILSNGEVNEDELEDFATTLIGLGAMIDAELVEGAEEAYPDNEDLHEILRAALPHAAIAEPALPEAA